MTLATTRAPRAVCGFPPRRAAEAVLRPDRGTGARDGGCPALERGDAARGDVAARHAGFTLIELMVVMAIIVVLASIGLALYTNSQTRAREAALKTDLFHMREAIDQYYADKNKYPPTLDALVSEKYLRAIPVDPFTNSTDTWQTTFSEPEPGNPSAEPGIYDVKSGSEQTSLEGTPYAEW